MYQRILVPLDGSVLAEQALPYARIIGKSLGSRIELLFVNEPKPGLWGNLDVGLSNKCREYLEAAAGPLRADGMTVSWFVQDGNPAETISTEATREPDTLVAMSTHGRSGITRWVLGSVTDKVLHATSNPMLIVRSEEDRPVVEPELKNAIVPLDGSPLAEQVLPHIAPLARALGLTLTLIRTVPVLDDRHPLSDDLDRVYQQINREAHAEAEEYLKEQVQRLSDEGFAQIRQLVTQDDPAGAIVDTAHGTPFSMVAMTTHGRSGVGRWVLGSVADKVVRHCGEPVLVIRVTQVSHRIGTIIL